MSDLYHDLLLEEARQPQHFGVMPEATVVLEEFNASCGDRVNIFLKVSADGQTIEQLQWTGEGCVVSQAAMSVLAGLVQGKDRQFIREVKLTELEQLLGIEDISLGRIKCLNLGLAGLKKWANPLSSGEK